MRLDLRSFPVYYINLDEATEKNKRTQRLLDQMGFKEIHRVSAIKHETGRMIGCARSHYYVLSNLKSPAIILEDDCALNRDFDGFVEIPENADALYLGISHWGRYLNHSGPYVHTSKTENECLRVYNMLATHAILYLSQEYINMCSKISRYYGYVINNHLDIGFAENQKYFNVYALDEPLLRQYEWSAVTTGKLSEHSIDVKDAESFYQQVLQDDSNFYRLNENFKSPFRQLISRRDVNGIPGYFVPTRII
jgi:hypothetical protein